MNRAASQSKELPFARGRSGSPVRCWAWACLLGWSAVVAERTPWTSGRVTGSPEPPAAWRVERIYPELELHKPIDLTFLPGSRELCIVDSQCKIWRIDTSVDPPAKNLLLDLRQVHQPVGSVLGFTFHPDYPARSYVYVNYNEPGLREEGAYLARFTLSGARPVQVLPESKKVLLRWASGGHNGCALAFGPDGYLYFSTGDAAPAYPPDSRYYTGQNNADILSCILRIDVDVPEAGEPYAVPPDNPFFGVPGVRPEIWAFGFRNPFRIAFDARKGDLWVGDVGWEMWEMIYRIRRGGNYGWALTEGPNPHIPLAVEVVPGPGPILPPVAAHPHSEAASITGGQVYYGERYPELFGAYIYGDWETGRFWALKNQEDRIVWHRELCDTSLKPIAFALDPRGELVILDHNGGLYQLAPNPERGSAADFPTRLSETGLFVSAERHRPAPGVVSYRIEAPMWNDFATAQRLIAVPGLESMATRGGVPDIAGGNWRFPLDTVLVRTLSLERRLGDPATSRRIETQILHWDGQAWNPYTYRWNEAQTDASLVAKEGANDTFVVADERVPEGKREIPWRFHSRAECRRCHNAWAGEPLTMNRLQLGSGDRSEWRRFLELGLLAAPGGAARSSPRLVDPYDEGQALAARARSWLHVNCGTCHKFGAGSSTAAQFNIQKSLRQSRAQDVAPAHGDFGLPEAKIIASGEAQRSTLVWRICTQGPGRMPSIGSRLVDERGAAAVMAWIDQIEREPERQQKAEPETAASPNEGSSGNPKREPGAAVKNAERKAWAAVLAREPDRFGIRQLLSDPLGALALKQAAYEIEDAHPEFRTTVGRVANEDDRPAVRELFRPWLPPGERQPVLGFDIRPETILALEGDAARGREIFFGKARCSECHRQEGQGKALGPDLGESAARYGREQLLEHIIRPSQLIAPEFRTVSVMLDDFEELSGMIRESNDEELVLIDATLTDHRVSRSKIIQLDESSLSSMPEGLLAALTAREAADLLAWLDSLAPEKPE